MLVTKKMLLALTLVGAIVGAGIGSLATRSSQTTAAANTNSDMTKPASTDYTAPTQQIAANDSMRFATTEEQSAYRQGFDAGFSSCEGGAGTANRSASYAPATSTTRVRRSSNSRRVYYDYNNAPRRTFWQKHRDKLTLAMGTGLGAAIGGLAGGKKGAGIGALAGLGGSALYTYKLRRRTPRY